MENKIETEIVILRTIASKNCPNARNAKIVF